MAAARNGSHAAADAVDQIDQGNAVLAGKVFDETALTALAPRAAKTSAALDGVILATYRHRPAVDFADATYVWRGCKCGEFAVRIVGCLARELADFLKRAGVEHAGDALADGEFA